MKTEMDEQKENLVYTCVIHSSKVAGRSKKTLLRMLEIWNRSLRENGNYEGEVAILTNMDKNLIAECFVERQKMVILESEKYENVSEIRRAKINNYEREIFKDRKSILFMDLDTVVVGDIKKMFEKGKKLRSAHSNLRLMSKWHCWNIMKKWDITKKIVLPSSYMKGFSSSVFSCSGEEWRKKMKEWSKLNKNIPKEKTLLDDQSTLNMAYAEGKIQVKKYQKGIVKHKNWGLKGDVTVLHFPVDKRVEKMEYYYERSKGPM
jgi:hypothetical protein